MKVLYVGWKSAQTKLPPRREPPSNYKSAEAIDKFNREEAARVRLLTDLPCFSRLSEVVVLDAKGKLVLEHSGEDTAKTFFQLVSAKVDGELPFRDRAPDLRMHAPTGPLVLCGFSLSRMLRIAALQLIHGGEKVPAGFWIDAPTIDPYHECIPATERDYATLSAFCASLNIKVPGPELEPTDHTPDMQSQIAWGIASKTLLFA